jgi:hypothetical protein
MPTYRKRSQTRPTDGQTRWLLKLCQQIFFDRTIVWFFAAFRPAESSTERGAEQCQARPIRLQFQQMLAA